MSKYEPTGDFRLIDNATGEQIGASAFEADSAFEAETARRTTMTMGPKDAGWDEYDAAAEDTALERLRRMREEAQRVWDTEGFDWPAKYRNALADILDAGSPAP